MTEPVLHTYGRHIGICIQYSDIILYAINIHIHILIICTYMHAYGQMPCAYVQCNFYAMHAYAYMHIYYYAQCAHTGVWCDLVRRRNGTSWILLCDHAPGILNWFDKSFFSLLGTNPEKLEEIQNVHDDSIPIKAFTWFVHIFELVVMSRAIQTRRGVWGVWIGRDVTGNSAHMEKWFLSSQSLFRGRILAKSKATKINDFESRFPFISRSTRKIRRNWKRKWKLHEWIQTHFWLNQQFASLKQFYFPTNL
jgi:hypothetical protein